MCRWVVLQSGAVPWSVIQPATQTYLMILFPPEIVLFIVDGSAVMCLNVLLLRECGRVLKFFS